LPETRRTYLRWTTRRTPKATLNLAVVGLVVVSATFGMLGVRGLSAAESGTFSLQLVADAQAASVDVQHDAAFFEITGRDAPDPMEGLRAEPTPEPAAVAPVILPPPVRSARTHVNTAVSGNGQLLWPVPGGYVSQYYWSGHLAIDIASSYGSAVVAADAGTITWAGWRNNGGGLVVLIQHANGIITGYNHLGTISVTVGQVVARGERIAGVGCTGSCTGPHVHFSVNIGGVFVNPLRYL
jgi:murein DD-endopeptidase MepM/ murein hydrolase activator NlpD